MESCDDACNTPLVRLPASDPEERTLECQMYAAVSGLTTSLVIYLNLIELLHLLSDSWNSSAGDYREQLR